MKISILLVACLLLAGCSRSDPSHLTPAEEHKLAQYSNEAYQAMIQPETNAWLAEMKKNPSYGFNVFLGTGTVSTESYGLKFSVPQSLRVGQEIAVESDQQFKIAIINSPVEFIPFPKPLKDFTSNRFVIGP